MPVEPAVAPFHILSETNALRQVVVHTPGEEMALVSPENADELLFDDILFLEEAREEHAMLIRLFQAAVGREDAVLQVTDLLRETFEAAEARTAFVDGLIERMPYRNFEAYESELKALDTDGLLRFAVTGQAPFPVTALPIPNLLFTRDLSAVDLLVVDERVVLIGQSERTSLGGVLAVARELLTRTSIEHVVMVNLPKARYCMHLDTVFTFADAETCVVFPPIIEESHDHTFILEAIDGDPSDLRLRPCATLRDALEDVTGRSYTFVRCGGEDPVRQRREQWTDGANLFAIRPGLVVGYDRNRATYDALRSEGFHVVDAESFLDFYGDSAATSDARIAVRLSGNELSRGRGGPRCMTMPLARSA